MRFIISIITGLLASYPLMGLFHQAITRRNYYVTGIEGVWWFIGTWIVLAAITWIISVLVSR